MEVTQFITLNTILFGLLSIYKVLTGDIALRVRDLVRQTCEAFEIKILKRVVSKEHVHILTSTPPWPLVKLCEE